MKILQWAIGICLAFLLSACGGGGDNSVPVSQAGPDQNVGVSTLVTLDGSASTDAENNPLTYQWSLTTRPTGSTAVLSTVTAAKPTFTPDMVGTYVATLVVNDGQVSSQSDSVTLNAKYTPQSNMAILRKVFDNNDAKRFDDNLAIFSPDFIGHSSSFPDGMYIGNAAIVNYFRETEGVAFPGGHHVIHQILGDGDYVDVDFSYTGKFTGFLTVPPLPPNDKVIEFRYNMILRFVDGKIVEGTWFSIDSFQLMLDLGLIKSVTF